jgi:multidrug resistance efflux pump
MKKEELDEKKEAKESKPLKSKKGKRILILSFGGFFLLLLVIYLIPVNFYIGGYGNILSANDAVLRAGSKGPIRFIRAYSGQRVKKDQIILELEDDVERADVERCQRELAAAQAELLLLNESVAIEKKRDEFQREIAKIKFEDSESEYTRVKGLRSSAATSDMELRMATAKRDMDQVDLLEKSIDKHNFRLAQVEVQKRKITTLDAQLNSAKRVLARRKIDAPMEGVLVMHSLSIGQVVDANEVLGQIFDDKFYQMVAHIPEQFGYYLKEGQSVRIELSAYPHWNFGYFWGHLYWVSPVVNPQASGDGTILIKAKIDTCPPSADLKAGMSGKISITAGKTSLLWRILGIKTYDKRPSSPKSR